MKIPALTYTDQEKILAIAILCDIPVTFYRFSYIRIWERRLVSQLKSLERAEKTAALYRRRYDGVSEIESYHDFNLIPDYFNSLDAIHQAEKHLNDHEWMQYENLLARLGVGERFGHWSAGVRTEAFFRTKFASGIRFSVEIFP